MTNKVGRKYGFNTDLQLDFGPTVSQDFVVLIFVTAMRSFYSISNNPLTFLIHITIKMSNRNDEGWLEIQ